LREDFWRAGESDGGHEVEYAGDYAEVVEASEGDADDGAGLVTAGERAEKCGGHGEAEIDDRAEPRAECEELHESKDVGHLLGLSQGRDYHRFLGPAVPWELLPRAGISPPVRIGGAKRIYRHLSGIEDASDYIEREIRLASGCLVGTLKAILSLGIVV
jgi:hypothetical protein